MFTVDTPLSVFSKYSSIPSLIRGFYYECKFSFVKYFFIIEISTWFFSITVMNICSWFSNVKLTLHSRKKLNLIMIYRIFDIVGFDLLIVFIGFFHLVFKFYFLQENNFTGHYPVLMILNLRRIIKTVFHFVILKHMHTNKNLWWASWKHHIMLLFHPPPNIFCIFWLLNLEFIIWATFQTAREKN